jgi:chemotaxis signal transduction protein
MKDLIIFGVAQNRYAIDLENIQRITQIPAITDIPNAHDYVDGMISYEKRVLKVMNFRKMVGLPTYDVELHDLFESLKGQHRAWVDSLQQAVEKKVHFQKTTDPHQCDMGKWLDNFTSYDDHVSAILKDLNNWHKQLHTSAIDILELRDECHECAIKEVETNVHEIFDHTMGYVDQFIDEFDIVANSLQKLLLYHGEKSIFAIKVDEIIDIAHVDENAINASEEDHKVSEFLEIEGVIELEDQLVNVISAIRLPTNEVA